MKHDVTLFKTYPVRKGQKIRIEDSKRSGDWEIIEVTENKMTLKCPISEKELTVDRFCFLVQELENEPWPGR